MLNEDLSHIVTGHTDYAEKIDEILIYLNYAEELDITSELRRSVSSHNLREKEKVHRRSPSVDSILLHHSYHKHPHIELSELRRSESTQKSHSSE